VVWDSASDFFFVSIFNETCPGSGSLCLRASIGAYVESWFTYLIKFDTSGSGFTFSLGSYFFWMGFCIISWMDGSNYGAGSLDLGKWLEVCRFPSGAKLHWLIKRHLKYYRIVLYFFLYFFCVILSAKVKLFKAIFSITVSFFKATLYQLYN